MPTKVPRPPRHAPLSRRLAALRPGVPTTTVCAAAMLVPLLQTITQEPADHGVRTADAWGAAVWDGSGVQTDGVLTQGAPPARKRAARKHRAEPRRAERRAARQASRARAAAVTLGTPVVVGDQVPRAHGTLRPQAVAPHPFASPARPAPPVPPTQPAAPAVSPVAQTPAPATATPEARSEQREPEPVLRGRT